MNIKRLPKLHHTKKTIYSKIRGANWLMPTRIIPITPSLPDDNQHPQSVTKLGVADNKQLLDEVEHDIMNYQNRGLCCLPKPKAGADNTNTRV